MIDERNEFDNISSYGRIIEEMTCSRAWGMSELSNWLTDRKERLKNHTSTKGIWYLMIPDGDQILPSVFKETNADNVFMHESLTIFRKVERAIEEYFVKKEGELSGLKEYETIPQMSIDYPNDSNNMIPWSGSIRSCLKSARHVYKKTFREYKIYIFSPSKYMILRNRLKIITKGSNKEIFDTLKMEAIVFESDTENKDYSKYLHGRLTEDLAKDEEELIKGGFNIELDDIWIIKSLPVPLSVISMGQNGRFLSYNMLIPQNLSEKSKNKLSLENLQKFMLYSTWVGTSIEKSNMGSFIEQNAFLYSIRIDDVTISQIKQLID